MQQHSRCKNTAAATEEESSVRLSRSWNPGPESQMQQHSEWEREPSNKNSFWVIVMVLSLQIRQIKWDFVSIRPS
jgi:hypothetical protein